MKCELRSESKWRCFARKRVKPKSIKGNEKKISFFNSKIKAEMALHSFRFGIESRKGKDASRAKLEELIAKNYPATEINSNGTNESTSELSDSQKPNCNSESSPTTKASVVLVKFDVKDDAKPTNSARKKKKDMSMPPQS